MSGGPTAYIPQQVAEALLSLLNTHKSTMRGNVDLVVRELSSLLTMEDGFEVCLDSDINRKMLNVLLENESLMGALGKELLSSVASRMKAC